MLFRSNQANIYHWRWVVSGQDKLLSATRLEGLHWKQGDGNGSVTSVTSLGLMKYEILFTTEFDITEFESEGIDIYGPLGIIEVKGLDTRFVSEIETGARLYDTSDRYIGTVDQLTDDFRLLLTDLAAFALTNATFYYKNPRIQLIISDDPDDAMQPYDTVVAKFGENSGYTFWYNGEQWTRSQLKTKNSQFIKFDVFDDQDQSYSSYSGSNFAGTNIFSYTPGSGNNDSVLGFPIQYTTNSTLADLTF